MIKRTKKLVFYAILVLIVGVLYVLFWIQTGIAVPCIFHKLTGFYCPGCGISRMSLSLLQLNLYKAFHYNSGVMIILPILIILFVRFILFYIRGEKKKTSKLYQIVVIIMLIWLIIFGVLRNIPAFGYLAPTANKYERLGVSRITNVMCGALF